MDPRPRYGCSDYRREMMMAALQARLRQDTLSEEERRELEKTLRSMEAEFYG
jgi:hypothetical protein